MQGSLLPKSLELGDSPLLRRTSLRQDNRPHVSQGKQGGNSSLKVAPEAPQRTPRLRAHPCGRDHNESLGPVKVSSFLESSREQQRGTTRGNTRGTTGGTSNGTTRRSTKRIGDIPCTPHSRPRLKQPLIGPQDGRRLRQQPQEERLAQAWTGTLLHIPGTGRGGGGVLTGPNGGPFNVLTGTLLGVQTGPNGTQEPPSQRSQKPLLSLPQPASRYSWAGVQAHHRSALRLPSQANTRPGDSGVHGGRNPVVEFFRDYIVYVCVEMTAISTLLFVAIDTVDNMHTGGYLELIRAFVVSAISFAVRMVIYTLLACAIIGCVGDALGSIMEEVPETLTDGVPGVLVDEMGSFLLDTAAGILMSKVPLPLARTVPLQQLHALMSTLRRVG